MSESRPAPVRVLCPPPVPAPLAERDDEALMVLAAGDHRGAFEVLAGRYVQRVTSYCAKFLGSPRAGEELAQEIFVEVWAERRRYRTRGRFQVFLFTVARNRCLNHARDEGRRSKWCAARATGQDTDALVAQSEQPDQLDVLLERERQRQVREALVNLPAKLREAVLLRFDQGLEYAEISRIVGRPEVTVRSRVFHALKGLREALVQEDQT